MNHLTTVVWNALILWAHYLEQTRHLTLIQRPPALDENFAACTDSSLINGTVTSVTVVDVASATLLATADLLLFSRGPGHSPLSDFLLAASRTVAGLEFIMATWVGTTVIAFQMLGARTRHAAFRAHDHGNRRIGGD